MIKSRLLLLLLGLATLFACDEPTVEENYSIDNGCLGYTPFENNWKEAYEGHYEQFKFCAERMAILKAETDSLVTLGDSLALYVQFILLGEIDPAGKVYSDKAPPAAYQYLVASSKRGYWRAKLDLAIMKDRFGKQKTGAGAIDDYYFYGDLFIHNEVQEDTVLIAEFMEHYGWSKEVAGKQAILVPIAFARYYLKQHYKDLTFSLLYHVDDKEEVYPFVQDPVYKWATELADIDAKQHLFSKEAVIAIMNRSPEMKGVNEIVAAGGKVEGAEFRTLLIF